MDYSYKTSGVCSRTIRFSLEDGTLKNVRFEGGCNGNLQGIARLVEGMRAEDAAKKLEGISCNGKPSSCPDQLAKAIRQALN